MSYKGCTCGANKDDCIDCMKEYITKLDSIIGIDIHQHPNTKEERGMSLREEIATNIYKYGVKAASGVVTSSDFEAKKIINLCMDAAIDAVNKAMDSPDLLGMTATIYKGKIIMVEESDLKGKHVKRSDAIKTAIKAIQALKEESK